MRWVITGASAFVGRNLVEACERQRIDTAPLCRRDADFRSLEKAIGAFERAAPADVIVHLASLQTGGSFTGTYPASLLRANVQIGLNVLEAWKRTLPAARLIMVGASCGYPADQGNLREDMFLSGEIHPSVAAYGASKRFLYVALQ